MVIGKNRKAYAFTMPDGTDLYSIIRPIIYATSNNTNFNLPKKIKSSL